MPRKQANQSTFNVHLPSAVRAAALLICAGTLTACGGSRNHLGTVPSAQVYGVGDRIPEGGGHYKVGRPYIISGVRYIPREDPNYDRQGVASWYGTDFHGRKTANGEIFDMNRFSAAHRTMPLPSYAKITNLDNGRTVMVRVNDRGPYAHDREIDMSRRASHALGFQRQGTTNVRVQYIGPAPLEGDDDRLTVANRNPGYAEPIRMAGAPAGPVAGQPPADPRVAGYPARSERPRYRRRAHAIKSYVSSNSSYIQPTGSTAAPGYYIQAASFSDPAKAKMLKGQLSEIGNIDVTPAKRGYGTFYRVRLGPLKDENAAYVALARVRAAGLNSARIVSN